MGSMDAQSPLVMSKRVHSPRDPDTRGICWTKWMDSLHCPPLRWSEFTMMTGARAVVT